MFSEFTWKFSTMKCLILMSNLTTGCIISSELSSTWLELPLAPFCVSWEFGSSKSNLLTAGVVDGDDAKSPASPTEDGLEVIGLDFWILNALNEDILPELPPWNLGNSNEIFDAHLDEATAKDTTGGTLAYWFGRITQTRMNGNCYLLVWGNVASFVLLSLFERKFCCGDHATFPFHLITQ